MKNEKSEQARVLSNAEKIWQAIKDTKIDMFCLPNQVVNMYCKPVTVEPSKLYLDYKAQAVLPALESAFKNIYNVEFVGKYIVVSNL